MKSVQSSVKNSIRRNYFPAMNSVHAFIKDSVYYSVLHYVHYSLYYSVWFSVRYKY